MNFEQERRGSRSRTLERSLSYSEAIRGNASGRSSIEIPSMVNTDVYTNEELKKNYRISQTYVEGKEITFPVTITNVDTNETLPSSEDYLSDKFDIQSSEDTDDEHCAKGLVMKIDIERNESPKPPSNSTTVHISNASTQPVVSSTGVTEDIYESIEVDDSFYNAPDTNVSSGHGYSTPYTRRKRKGTSHRRRLGRPRRSRRVVFKDGEENVPVRSSIPAKSIKYMRDIVNTVINSKWRFLLLLMVFAHFTFWLFFAGIWYIVTRSYMDDIGDGQDHCVVGTSSFAGFLMMAVETQMTIGYGTRYPSEECPEAIIVMVLEIVAGTALSGGLTSLLFAKMIRPNRHVTSVGFSKKATVCLRDGELCLQFRVWDLLNVHLVGSTITAYMMKPIRTLEGECVQNYIHQLKLLQASAFLLWPITVVHVIDAESPLYDLSAENMMDYRFEIVVCLTGSSKNMGTMTQSRTSYLSKEIIWGYRFKNVIKYSKKEESYIIDTDNLNEVEQVETPLCSAMQLKEFEGISRKILSPNISIGADSPSFSQNGDSLPSTLYGGSVLSTPSFNRHGTQRSFGWNFRREYPDGSEGDRRIDEVCEVNKCVCD